MFDRQRLISALIALAYASAMWRRSGWNGVLALVIPLIIALGLIWYAGTISRHAHWFSGWRGRRINKPTPPSAVRTLGWVFLLSPAIFLAVQWLRTA